MLINELIDTDIISIKYTTLY